MPGVAPAAVAAAAAAVAAAAATDERSAALGSDGHVGRRGPLALNEERRDTPLLNNHFEGLLFLSMN